MSQSVKKVTTRTLQRMKKKKEPIAMITAYDFPTAKIADKAGADMILVGDSLGMVVLGYESTIPVTLEDMIHHTKAVTRGTKRAMVIADLPFMIAHLSKDEVLRASARLLQVAGAYGVKLEGGSEVCANVKALTTAGIPVVAHLGLTPQSVNQLGGYLIQGKDEKSAKHLIAEAKRLQEAGAIALVLECVPEELAQVITDSLYIPVIGIGAGRFCDGQVLVYHDILQFGGDFTPSFVKTYASVGKAMAEGVQAYIQDVKQHRFPEENHVTHLSQETVAAVYGTSEGN
ncbi:3-methyl-2-oxobutanoate hydroxymethyltransferase [Thermoflavimicrobium daqui]|uniref:3-methyl-2-oxobutanoate hydroxymethyltransferase n=1 Tax=Thermoflavimicrobium daqui TaxID=2137476 RepID=A0A364K0Y8_9BACL|nr:3-methyl-2-oxobutanoate hydroxymethyltransferase [Thermoflavimicrobium daqui]RAL21090.1 3-methyl-2-oxobutanoate hydroxymethyltransferase [Thermoflavimicrobium daqui]